LGGWWSGVRLDFAGSCDGCLVLIGSKIGNFFHFAMKQKIENDFFAIS